MTENSLQWCLKLKVLQYLQQTFMQVIWLNCIKKFKLFHLLKCGIDILFINPLQVFHINMKAFVIMNFMPIPEGYSVRLCSLCLLSTLPGWQKGFVRPFYKLRPLKALLSFTYMILPCWCQTSMEAALKTSCTQESITLWWWLSLWSLLA